MRSQKLDAIRGCAIIGMIIFHAHFILLSIFGYTGQDFPALLWHILGRIVAITFIVVAGISFGLSTREKPTEVIIKSSMKRVFLLSAIALLISIVTFNWFYEQRIVFGIIHFFALVALISPLFLYFGSWNILLGIIVFGLQFVVNYMPATSDILFPIGIISSSFYSADYYPLIPWFGYFLIGYGVMYHYGNNPLIKSWLGEKHEWIGPLAWVGRYALILYIVHVPLLYLCFAWIGL